MFSGSSPRAWGTQNAGYLRSGSRRFIPTRVGNTAARSIRARAESVHPHARGEHPVSQNLPDRQNGSSPRAWGTQIDPNAALSQPGSSPRAWGTQDIHVAPALEHRFIPTRVGNTAFIC